ncbi:MAG: CapA family protein [Candidatus Aminicenantes bacterium]|nr:CapA family protein [Candidatus Aminicenantes bacterium]
MKNRFMLCFLVLTLWLFLIPFVWSEQTSDKDTFTMALTGDSIITRRLSVYNEPSFLKMIELIRSADVAFTNLEMLFHDYEPYPMHQSGGTYMRADPALANELAWAGFDMLSRANNHTGDYGVEGMRLTTKYTVAAGLVNAGVGESLPEAREAKFLETAKARVALISCSSTYPDHVRAGKTRGDIPARPGLNPIRYSTTYILAREKFETLRGILREIGMRVPEKGDSLRIFRNRFIVGDKTEILTELNKEDLEEITSVVRNASRLAEYTIVTIHAHESDKSRFEPAKFIVSFARAMIDAGADVFVGHGPHLLRGIEIYKGKPIFYSLANFMLQNETLLRLPPENYERYSLGPEAHVADFNDARYGKDRRGFPATPEYWESVIAAPVWKGKELIALRLYPISLGFGKPRTVRGRPLLAGADLSKKIILDLKRLSKPFGTTIDFKDGIGIVRIPEKKRGK